MTTENSRADALTKQQRKSLEWLDRLCTPSMYLSRLGPIRDYIKEVLAASPSSQPAAAPIDEPTRAVTCSRCRGTGYHYEWCVLKDSQPAPAPADERAAQELLPIDRKWVTAKAVNLVAEYRNCKTSETEEVMQHFVDFMQAALQDAAARAASANETGAEVAQQLSAEITELKIKLGSYEREREDQTRYLAAQSEEIADLKYQLTHADARVGLTAEARATIMDACRSISRGADGLKAGCAIDDEWPDAEDKAFYDAELRLLARLVALLNDSGQSEPETATVARIEQLRKALFESRDAMRVMSNWVKKSDPAGHSWAVRMVDRANAALNGEPEPRSEVMDAVRDVLDERHRQIDAEGWTPAHDDEHDKCEMALAAIVYTESAVGYHPSCPDTWPWSPKWFKPTTPRRDLVKAAALVIAEIERLDRAATRTGGA